MHQPLSSPELLASEATRIIFEDPFTRPAPQAMARLVLNGLTEDDIVRLGTNFGYNEPTMTVTLEDVDKALPSLQKANDVLATEFPDATILFAARDAEILADDMAIRHPDIDSYLLPASESLMDELENYSDSWVIAFLEQFGLSQTAVEDPAKSFVLVDSGFAGTICHKLSRQLYVRYGATLRKDLRLHGKLMSVSPNHHQSVSPILEESDMPQTYLLPTRATRIANKVPDRFATYDPRFTLAVFMQTLPRFHGEFWALEEDVTGTISATADRNYDHRIHDDVDGLNGDSIYHGLNSSIINPVAAAVVMHRVVREALEKST
jgi:uncharacterized protein YheU (UPF0270 family)